MLENYQRLLELSLFTSQQVVIQTGIILFELFYFYCRYYIEFVYPAHGSNSNFFTLENGKWYWEHCIWSFASKELDSSFYWYVGSFKCYDLV
jgi:hypothetical protein